MLSPREVLVSLGEELADVGPSLGLVPEGLRDDMARREGTWNGRPLVLATRVFSDACGRSFRVARVEGEAMSSLTIVGLAGETVLGVDVVQFQDRFATVIADLRMPPSRTFTDLVDRLLAGTRDLRQESADGVPPDSPFGPAVLWGKPLPSQSEAVAAAIRLFVAAFREHADVPEVSEEGASRVRAYLAWLAASKKQMKTLTKLFGEEWVPRYFDSVFLAAPSAKAAS
jgi:hypothetical protein